ncbi:Hemolysin C [Novipirellula galeiformis]|uniref:Hemolysin C n=1 Tax=Novipirellula galeiformis TaxID=2528004 RepID=A0A5C6CQL9_9BACT|nr:hemolysin family protein [Novipirellula galeiformis]TWU25119.1 Hemolysin C [Novipirellula galeiformis]
MDYFLLITYLSIAIGVSFLCSIAEAVLLSITPSYIAERRTDKSRSAQRVIRLKENIDRPLAAILSLNTIAHTVGAAGVGAQAARIYGDHYLGLISAVLTLMILVFSEIIPKTIGALRWRQMAGTIAWSIEKLIPLMLPFVWLSEHLTRWLAGNKQQRLVTRAEIAAVAELGTREGLLKHYESRILRNLLKLESITVEEIMTPNTVVIALEESQPLSAIADEVKTAWASRIPLYRERRDVVTGFVLRNDLLAAIASGVTDKPLREYARPVQRIHEDESIMVALDQLVESRSHLAIVVDSFGGLEGIVTLEDVLETLLGMEIVDEQDANVDMQALARQRWEQRRKNHLDSLPPKPARDSHAEPSLTDSTNGHAASTADRAASANERAPSPDASTTGDADVPESGDDTVR